MGLLAVEPETVTIILVFDCDDLYHILSTMFFVKLIITSCLALCRYIVTGFIDKNKDPIYQDFMRLLYNRSVVSHDTHMMHHMTSSPSTSPAASTLSFKSSGPRVPEL